MPNLQDVINELRRLGVLATEIKIPRKTVAQLMQKAEDLAEEGGNPVEE